MNDIKSEIDDIIYHAENLKNLCEELWNAYIEALEEGDRLRTQLDNMEEE